MLVRVTQAHVYDNSISASLSSLPLSLSLPRQSGGSTLPAIMEHQLLHAVVLPYPLQGHLNPFMLVSRLLLPKGFTITFVVSEQLATKLQQPSLAVADHDPDPAHQHPRIRIVSIPDGLPPHHPRGGAAFRGSDPQGFQSSYEAMQGMRAGFEDLLEKLARQAPPVSCILADTFVTWSHDAASRFNIPRVVFYTTNAHAFSLLFHSTLLVSKGLLPFKDNGASESPGDLIDCIPGVPPLYAKDFPFSMRFLPQFTLDQAQHIREVAGILLNTFHEIESTALDVMQKDLPVYPIGPLLLFFGDNVSDSGPVSYWQEENKCLEWLDTRLPSSVLYVSFGSISTLTSEQLRELAQGLEDSQQAFLWVIRPNAVDGSLSDILPEGFSERTKDQGLIISWAPQLQVLDHRSVGGFLTHGGWNSVTENLSKAGIPMICWPQGAEQMLNCRLLVDEWKIGMEFHKEKDGMVTKGEVERIVKDLMQGEEGKEARKRAVHLKEAARRAVQEGGSSRKSLEAFVEDMKRRARQQQT